MNKPQSKQTTKSDQYSNIDSLENHFNDRKENKCNPELKIAVIKGKY